MNYVQVPNINNIAGEESTICFVYRADELLDSYGTVFHLLSNDNSYATIATFSVKSGGYQITAPYAKRHSIEEAYDTDDDSKEIPVCIAWSAKQRYVSVSFNGVIQTYKDATEDNVLLDRLYRHTMRRAAILILGTEAKQNRVDDGGSVVVTGRTGAKFTGEISYMLVYDRVLSDVEIRGYIDKQWANEDSLVFRWNDANFREYFHGNISVHLNE